MPLLLYAICEIQVVGDKIEFLYLACTFSWVSIWPPGRHRHTIGGYAAQPLAIRELRVDDGGGARSHASPPPRGRCRRSRDHVDSAFEVQVHYVTLRQQIS